MSRIHRVVEKAEREGRLARTRRFDDLAVAPAAEPALVRPETALPPPHPEPAGPSIAGPEAPPPAPDDGRIAEPLPAATADCTPHPLLVVAAAPQSAVAEQYRLLRTRLAGRDNGRTLQVLVITSPLVGDGKTITSANLALAIAQEYQRRVVLVEADLRRPCLASLFGLGDSPGLADVLAGTAALDEALVSLPQHHLTVLPGGTPPARSAELLGSSAMRRVADTLRARFDRVIVDSPPAVLADTHVLAGFGDGILMVVRAGVTPRPALERALGVLPDGRVIGLVLNDVDDGAGAYGYGAPYAARGD
ncbi:MAG TPA: CpsD/CapB family tyrosine-protein kinase [Vicinamibacterales bacterium]|nr:CpsD/CapB family tyrosine-protein kinase [Vicinamibacterales bacterium]